LFIFWGCVACVLVRIVHILGMCCLCPCEDCSYFEGTWWTVHTTT